MLVRLPDAEKSGERFSVLELVTSCGAKPGCDGTSVFWLRPTLIEGDFPGARGGMSDPALLEAWQLFNPSETVR
jgi:hypothetical protein